MAGKIFGLISSFITCFFLLSSSFVFADSELPDATVLDQLPAHTQIKILKDIIFGNISFLLLQNGKWADYSESSKYDMNKPFCEFKKAPNQNFQTLAAGTMMEIVRTDYSSETDWTSVQLWTSPDDGNPQQKPLQAIFCSMGDGNGGDMTLQILKGLSGQTLTLVK